MEKADVTLTEEALKLLSVAFIVGLVVPTATPPKATLERVTKLFAPLTNPKIGICCGESAAVSVTFNVAVLSTFPVAGLAKKVIPKLQVPPPAVSVNAPVPDWPLVGKLQLVPPVGAAKEKLVALGPVMLCAEILIGVAPTFVMLTFKTAVVEPTLMGPS